MQIRIKNQAIKPGNIRLALVSLLVSLILAEMAARVYLTRFAPQEQFNRFASINQLRDRYGQAYLTEGGIAPHRYIGYIPAPNFREGPNRHNALGYRGAEITQPKPESVYRIVCLGGSTTYSAIEDVSQSYPVQLQAYLRQNGYPDVEVINGGMVGYTSWETLVNLQFRVLDLDPDLVLIYHAINDVYPRLVWPPTAYRGDNSGSRILRLQSVQMPILWEYSTALRMAGITLGYSEPHSSIDWQFIELPSTAYGDAFLEQKENGTYPQGIFDETPASAMLDANPPVYFERNLTNMVAIAQAQDIEVVLLTFAYGPSTNPRVGSEEFQTGIAEGNEVIRQVATTTGAHLYDFAGDMPSQRKYFSDGHHFTIEGNQLRAALIGDWLINVNLLPE